MIRFLTSPKHLEFLLSMTQPEISNCLIFNSLKAKSCSRGLRANGLRLDNPWSLLEMGEILFCSSLGWLSLHVMVKQAVLGAIYPNQKTSGGRICSKSSHIDWRVTTAWKPDNENSTKYLKICTKILMIDCAEEPIKFRAIIIRLVHPGELCSVQWKVMVIEHTIFAHLQRMTTSWMYERKWIDLRLAHYCNHNVDFYHCSGTFLNRGGKCYDKNARGRSDDHFYSSTDVL